MYKEKPIDKIKQYVSILDIVQKYGYIPNHKNFIACPFHNEKTPSCEIYPSTNKFKCFGCGVGGDVVDFVQQIEKCSLNEAIKKILDMYGLNDDSDDVSYKPIKIIIKYIPPNKELTKAQLDKIKSYIKACIKDVGNTDYFTKRGFTTETIKRFKLGYDIKRQSVVIPYNKALTYYQNRSVVDKVFFKPKTKDAGQEPLFNECALSQQPPIFVVESPMCAISIAQCGGASVSICGSGSWLKIIRYTKGNKKMSHLILCLDNDNAGRIATEKLAEELKELKYSFEIVNISDECKDPNELMMIDMYRLKENIKKVMNGYSEVKV